MMQKKAHPMDVKIEIVNAKDWKNTNNIAIKVKGLFRNSGWRIESVLHKVSGEIIRVDINSKHLGGMSLMVLTPFEVIENVQIATPHNINKICVFIDGDEYATQIL
ncbi:MAG: hypothetical protein ACFFD2_18915 [Promethearchaeota archaeon]